MIESTSFLFSDSSARLPSAGYQNACRSTSSWNIPLAHRLQLNRQTLTLCMFWFLSSRQPLLHNIIFLDTCQKMMSTMCPVSGQGLICFKCGSRIVLQSVVFSGICNTCGKERHINVVCKRNPNCIIKWQRSGSSFAGSTSVASSRGSALTVATPRGTVQMMAGPPPAPYSSCPQYYYPPPGYYWPPP